MKRTAPPTRWLAFAACVIIALPLAWVAAHRLSPAPAPPPWTERDLPPPPDPRVNGAVAVMGSSAASFPIEDYPLTDRLEAQPPRDRWERIVAGRAAFEEWAADPARTAEVAAAEAALGAERFADPCRGLASRCHPLQVVGLTRFVVMYGYTRALAGEWAEAFARAVALLEASDDLLRTARTYLGHIVAIDMSHRAVDQLRVLLAAVPDRAPIALSLERVERALGAIERNDVHIRRAIINDALAMRELVIGWIASPSGTSYDPLAPYVTNARSTIAAADAYYVAVVRWIDAGMPAGREPRFEQQATGFGWWAWNPGGKELLDMFGVDLARPIREHRNRADALFAARAELGRALRQPPLLAPTEPAPTM
jgi:hypothetical protein